MYISMLTRTFPEYILPYSVRMRENMDQKKFHIWTLFTQCRICKIMSYYWRISGSGRVWLQGLNVFCRSFIPKKPQLISLITGISTISFSDNILWHNHFHPWIKILYRRLQSIFFYSKCQLETKLNTKKQNLGKSVKEAKCTYTTVRGILFHMKMMFWSYGSLKGM